jgi:hypothetical protein
MAAAALPDKHAAGGTQQVTQCPVEPRRHSGDGGFGFPQGGDLQEQRGRIETGMIVRQ